MWIWRLEWRRAASKRTLNHGSNGAMNLDVRTDQIKSLELAGHSLLFLLLAGLVGLAWDGTFDRPWPWRKHNSTK